MINLIQVIAFHVQPLICVSSRKGNEGLPGPAVGPDGPSRAGGSRDAHDELEEARARRGGEGGGESSAATSGYRAVAPDMKSSYDAAERRRQMIQVRYNMGNTKYYLIPLCLASFRFRLSR